jgi:opacity protein-like surface antigen
MALTCSKGGEEMALSTLRISTSKVMISALPIAILLISSPLPAQVGPGQRWSLNVGGGVTPLVGDISSRLNTGWHVTAGGGYNFNPSFGINLEYSYTGLGVSRAVLNSLSVPNGNAHVNAITLNPIWRFATGERFAAYFTAGGGYYRRTVQFTQPTAAVVTVFDPWWGYFGPAIVPVNQVLGSVTSNAGGANAGVGITTPLGRGGLKLYAEIRYHYAATHRDRTQLLPVTFGIRW